jgi:D-alanyl-D-alanine carboxypeptidase
VSEALPTPTEAPATPTGARSFGELVAGVRSDLADYAGLFPAGLVYVRQGDRERTLTVGRADPGDTVMLASVTKTLVAVAVMSLVDEGTLRLSDTVGSLLPGLVPRGDDITVEMLLGMTSGLYSYDASGHYPGPGVLPAAGLVGLVRDMREPVAFPPGSEGMESNTNYAVLQLLVEDVTGHPLDQVLATRVLRPLGLRHTALGGTPTAHGYDGRRDVTVVDPPHPSAAAGGVATVADVGHLLDALLAGDAVSRKALADMLRVRADVDGSPYGLGLRVREDLPCGPVYGQAGGNDGYAVKAWTSPELDRTVVAALTDGSAEGIAGLVADDAICD